MKDKVPTLDVREPRPDEWVRVNDAPESYREMVLVKDEKAGTFYLVTEDMMKRLREKMPKKLVKSMVFMVCTNKMENYLWPVPMPVPDDHPAYRAMKEWVQVRALH